MEWHALWDEPFTAYLRQFDNLLGDVRTRTTFTDTVNGVSAAGALVCQRMAACAPVLATAHNGAHRSLRLVTGARTKRAPHRDAGHLPATFCTQAGAHLGSVPADELWLIADGSQLRQPYARGMPHLLRVTALAGSLVHGERPLKGLGMTPNRRGVLSHRLCRSKAPGFISEPHEVQQALPTVRQAIASLTTRMVATWSMDAGVDDVAVWRTLWAPEAQLLGRVKYLDRVLAVQDRTGLWHDGDIVQARQQVHRLGTAEPLRVVQRGRQHRPKEQRGGVDLWVGNVRRRYMTKVRRPGGAGRENRRCGWWRCAAPPQPWPRGCW